MNLFRRRDGFVFALTYGADADWVRNVVAAGGCEVLTRRTRYTLTDPQVYVDEERADMPLPVRRILGIVRVSEFLYLRIAP